MFVKTVRAQLTFMLIAFALFNFVSCSNGPKDCMVNSLTKGTMDFDPDIWIFIGCKSGSHYYTGSPNHAWKPLDGNGSIVMASGEVVGKDFDLADSIVHKFSKIHSLNVTGPGKRNFNDLLRETLKTRHQKLIEEEFEVKLIRLLGTANFSHEVAIFVKGGEVKWALSCKSYCNDDEPRIFKIQERIAVPPTK